MTNRKCASDKKVPSIFLHDQEIRRQHPLTAGIDEAGRGPLAGPVVAAAVILPEGVVIEGLRDSKKVAEKERNRLFWEVVKKALSVGVGIVGADIIDRINILQATKRAMKEAVEDLGMTPDILLIDAVRLPDVDIEQRAIIRGESISASIAAASIIAKVVRDDIMYDYHETYPGYNFRGHKGYSTKEHMGLVDLLGPCPIHRMSFRKVREEQTPIVYEQ